MNKVGTYALAAPSARFKGFIVSPHSLLPFLLPEKNITLVQESILVLGIHSQRRLAPRLAFPRLHNPSIRPTSSFVNLQPPRTLDLRHNSLGKSKVLGVLFESFVEFLGEGIGEANDAAPAFLYFELLEFGKVFFKGFETTMGSSAGLGVGVVVKALFEGLETLG